jgi:hypothetical protein
VIPFSRSRSIESITRSSTFLIGAKRPRLAQQLIDQCRLAVIDVRNDCDITDFIHSKDASSGGRKGTLS